MRDVNDFGIGGLQFDDLRALILFDVDFHLRGAFECAIVDGLCAEALNGFEDGLGAAFVGGA